VHLSNQESKPVEEAEQLQSLPFPDHPMQDTTTLQQQPKASAQSHSACHFNVTPEQIVPHHTVKRSEKVDE
jgi:hypothetical protein